MTAIEAGSQNRSWCWARRLPEYFIASENSCLLQQRIAQTSGRGVRCPRSALSTRRGTNSYFFPARNATMSALTEASSSRQERDRCVGKWHALKQKRKLFILRVAFKVPRYASLDVRQAGSDSGRGLRRDQRHLAGALEGLAA